jgi:CheY-like chemotaxis protein
MHLDDEAEPASALAYILIAEDEVLTRMVLAEELRDAGFFVIEASNADDAMAYLKTGSQIDLVFSDIQMPGSMDGLELARRLRVEHPSLPVILSSGRQGAEGVAPFISKPYRMERVISIVLKTLRLD